MPLLPKWKIQRELRRLKVQMHAWTGNLYEPVLRRKHDRWRGVQPTPHDLSISLTRKIAIFLIYQPRGVVPSIMATLRWLVDNGYAPLIISNSPISSADYSKLATLAWRIFERPNFGYDFGGYRDGVLLLKSWGLEPDRLLILNDSIWMPTRANSTVIKRLEAASEDIVGGIRQPELVRQTGRIRKSFLESYLLLVNPSAMQNRSFLSFWENYPASSIKRNAVRRGEREFTTKMVEGGLSARGLFSIDTFGDAIAGQTNEFLKLTILYASDMSGEATRHGQDLYDRFRDDEEWRREALEHIGRTMQLGRFNAVFCYPADMLFGMDFLKKSRGAATKEGHSVYSQMRRQLLRAVAAGDLLPLLPEIQCEIEAIEAEID